MLAWWMGLTISLVQAPPSTVVVEEPRGLVTPRSRAPQKLPLEAIQGPYKKRVTEIVSKPVCFRKSAVESFPCEPKLLDWLIDHPEFVAALWKRLGVDVASIERIQGGYEAKDGEAITVRCYPVHVGTELRIYYCTAEANRPLVAKRLHAEMVLAYRYRFSRGVDGRYFVTHQIEGYASASGAVLKAVMRIASGSTEQVVDECLESTLAYFSVLCQLMQVSPTWALKQANRPPDSLSARDAEALKEILDRLAPIALERELPPTAIVDRPMAPPTEAARPGPVAR
jgi:hypothetical protein